MTRPTPFQKGAAETAVASTCREQVLPSLRQLGKWRDQQTSLLPAVSAQCPSLTAAGVSDDHHQTEDINLASAKRRHFEIGSAPASIALALFVASTCLTRPSCGHRNVDATSIKISATNSHEVTEGVPLPNADTLLPRRQPGHQRSSPSKNVGFV